MGSFSLTISLSKIRALPEVGLIRPKRVRMVVLFPAPLGPINPKISPSGTERFEPEIYKAIHDNYDKKRSLYSASALGLIDPDIFRPEIDFETMVREMY